MSLNVQDRSASGTGDFTPYLALYLNPGSFEFYLIIYFIHIDGACYIQPQAYDSSLLYLIEIY